MRYTIQQKAKELHITGYAKNLSNGNVEIIAEGNNLETFIEFCKKGPKEAKIKSIAIEEQQYKREFTSFETK